MPTRHCEPDYAALARRRAEIRALLLRKGLKEGCGKWGYVFARHLRKSRY
jgi:hypothetical protein